MSVPRTAPEAGPLPSVPCLTYDGWRVTWTRWEIGPRILCQKLATSCESCRDPGPDAYAIGTVHPPTGTTTTRQQPVKRRPGEQRRWVQVEAPARPYWRLYASCCPACHRVDVITLDGTESQPVEAILCDGCDVLCAVGATLTEARETLVALGGWTGGEEADWDLCPACNPHPVAAARQKAAALREEAARIEREAGIRTNDKETPR